MSTITGTVTLDLNDRTVEDDDGYGWEDTTELRVSNSRRGVFKLTLSETIPAALDVSSATLNLTVSSLFSSAPRVGRLRIASAFPTSDSAAFLSAHWTTEYVDFNAPTTVGGDVDVDVSTLLEALQASGDITGSVTFRVEWVSGGQFNLAAREHATYDSPSLSIPPASTVTFSTDDDYRRYDTTNDSDWAFDQTTATELDLRNEGRSSGIIELSGATVTSATDVSAYKLKGFMRSSSGTSSVSVKASLTVGAGAAGPFGGITQTSAVTFSVSNSSYAGNELDIDFSAAMTELKTIAGGSDITAIVLHVQGVGSSNLYVATEENAVGGLYIEGPAATTEPMITFVKPTASQAVTTVADDDIDVDAAASSGRSMATLVATLTGPGGLNRTLSAGSDKTDLSGFSYYGDTGAYTLSVTATDDQSEATTEQVAFTVSRDSNVSISGVTEGQQITFGDAVSISALTTETAANVATLTIRIWNVVDGFVDSIVSGAETTGSNTDNATISVSGGGLPVGDYLAHAYISHGGTGKDMGYAFSVVAAPPPAPTVTSQATGDRTPIITGTFDASETTTLTVTVNGVTYTLGGYGNLTASGDTWTLDLSNISPLPYGTYSVTATATNAGGSTSDTTNNELVIVEAPDAPTVTSQTTGDTTPVITGTFNASETTTLEVTLGGDTYTLGTDDELTASGNNWTLDLSTEPALSVGTYDITATATNAAGATSDATSGELVIVAAPTAPTVTSQKTSDTTPIITGTFTASETTTLTVTVDGTTYTLGTDAELTTSGNNWTLDLSSLDPAIALGTYNVTATATNVAGSTSDATSGELIVNDGPPDAPTVTTQTTTDTTPLIAGTFNADATTTLTVAVSGVTYTLGTDEELTSSGDTWSLALPPIEVGIYSVTATATNANGSTSDSGSNELTVVATPDLPTPDTTAVDTLIFRGDAPAVAQVAAVTWTTTTAGHLVEFRVNGQRAWFVTTSNDEPTSAADFVSWWNNSERPPSFGLATASLSAVDTSVVLLSAATAGTSFRVDLGEVSASVSVAVALVTRSRGPLHLDDPKNWRLDSDPAEAFIDRFGRVPGSGDVLRLDSGRIEITEGVTWLAPLTRTGGKLYARGADFRAGQRVQVDTTGTLPTGLAADTVYQVASFDWLSGEISLNDDSGNAINVTGDGSGASEMFVVLDRLEAVGDFSGGVGDAAGLLRPPAFAVRLADANRTNDENNVLIDCGASSLGFDFGRSRLDVRIRATGGATRGRTGAIELANNNTDSKVTILEGSLAIAARPGQSGTLGPLVAHGGAFVLGPPASLGSLDAVNATMKFDQCQIRGRIHN